MKMMGMMATASMLQAYRSGMASDYTTVSGISKDDALAAMDKETWYTNEETVDAGFASKVLGDSEAKASATCSGRIVMPENAIVTALTTPRKKTYALPERVAAVVARVRGDMGKKAKGVEAKPVQAGENLAARLEQEIPKDGDERQDTLERMADAAGIEVSTINQAGGVCRRDGHFSRLPYQCCRGRWLHQLLGQ